MIRYLSTAHEKWGKNKSVAFIVLVSVLVAFAIVLFFEMTGGGEK